MGSPELEFEVFLNLDHYVTPDVFPKWDYATREERFALEEEMFNRTDLFTHIRRVSLISFHLSYFLEPYGYYFDRHKLFRMSFHHDDEEFILGDIPSPVKLKWTEKEREDYERKQDAAIVTLSQEFYNLPPHLQRRYVQDTREAHKKLSNHARLIDIADKLDGLGETLHELRCGNKSFLSVLENYKTIFKKFDKYPMWQILRNDPSIHLNPFVSDEEISNMDILDKERFSSELELRNVLLEGNFPDWYRSWIGLSFAEFDRNPEKFILPGWYPELWEKWGKEGQSKSGLFIARSI